MEKGARVTIIWTCDARAMNRSSINLLSGTGSLFRSIIAAVVAYYTEQKRTRSVQTRFTKDGYLTNYEYAPYRHPTDTHAGTSFQREQRFELDFVPANSENTENKT
eukprot:scaffold5402_cov285-Chaetoceros_neogracile.AAC.6